MSSSIFSGKWKEIHEETVGFDEFFEALGVPKTARDALRQVVCDLEFSVNGDSWKCAALFSCSPQPIDYIFKLGEKFEAYSIDGKKFTCTVHKEGDKLVEHHHELEDTPEWVSHREVSGDIMTVTSICGDVKMVKKWKKV